MKNNLVDVLGSELPIFNDKGAFKYIDEIASSGQYKQVAWQSIGSLYIPPIRPVTKNIMTGDKGEA